MADPDQIRLAGLTGPWETSIQVETNTKTGDEHTRYLEGTLSECQAYKAAAKSIGATHVMLQPSGGNFWKVTAMFPFDEFGYTTAVSVHELDFNVLQVSYAQNPILRSKLSDQQIGVVAGIVRDFEAGNYATDGDLDRGWAKALIDVATRTNNNTDAGDLFVLVAGRKADSFIQFNQVYRRTITAASPQQVQASYEGVGAIWTTSEVMSWEGLASSGFFQLQAGMQWLRYPPHIEMVRRQKTQISYHYEDFKQASKLLYLPYASAVLLAP